MKGDLSRAEAEVKALMTAFPNAAPVHVESGMLQTFQRNLPGARKAFERALELEPNNTEALAGLVTIDIAQNRLADARARVDARLARTPDDPTVLVLAARTHATAKDLPRAEQLLLKAVEVSPSNLQAYSLLGQLYVQQQKLDQAREKFVEMAKRQPKAVGAETMVGMILQMQGKTAEAQKQYERVLGLDARSPVAANNLAWLYAESGTNLDVALQLAQTAKAGLPDSGEINDTLGWVYYKKNLASSAVLALREAVTREPQNPSFNYHLGLALAKSGDNAGARQALERALKDPTFTAAADARQALNGLK